MKKIEKKRNSREGGGLHGQRQGVDKDLRKRKKTKTIRIRLVLEASCGAENRKNGLEMTVKREGGAREGLRLNWGAPKRNQDDRTREGLQRLILERYFSGARHDIEGTTRGGRGP